MSTVPTRRQDPLQSLADAFNGWAHVDGTPETSARDLDAALRSAVKAVLPGRQQKRNIESLMDTARAAFVRSLRRRSRG